MSLFDKVSIIIPTFNRRHLIGQTIDNVLSQTKRPYEIIVVDDNSADGTLSWLQETYGTQLILLSNNGKGPGAARNTGLRVATGDYIKFFDSDDIMTANTLEVQVRVLEQTAKPFVTSVYFYAYEKDNHWIATDNAVINYRGAPQHRPLYHWMIWGLFITIPSMLFRKDFLDKVGEWPEEMVTSEDWAYLWRMSMIEPYPAHTNECAFIYRVHENQSTGANLNNDARDKEKYEVLSRIFEQDVRNGTFSWFEKQLFLNKFFQMYLVSVDSKFKERLSVYKNVFSHCIWQWYRIKMKFGRMKTRSDWQPMHGVFISNAKINDFIKTCLH